MGARRGAGHHLRSQGRVELSPDSAARAPAQDGTISYWALKHPPGKPDFHHPDAFALEIE
ncbi:MAG: hypothetical protein HYY83_05345 [Deltaproteobacteria bacterium]|nr:hypothetical protein [Deltaproteobacteria bacterium]